MCYNPLTFITLYAFDKATYNSPYFLMCSTQLLSHLWSWYHQKLCCSSSCFWLMDSVRILCRTGCAAWACEAAQIVERCWGDSSEEERWTDKTGTAAEDGQTGWCYSWNFWGRNVLWFFIDTIEVFLLKTINFHTFYYIFQNGSRLRQLRGEVPSVSRLRLGASSGGEQWRGSGFPISPSSSWLLGKVVNS